MKISNDTIGNRTRDLPTCSAVPIVREYTVIIRTQFGTPIASVTMERLNNLTARHTRSCQ